MWEYRLIWTTGAPPWWTAAWAGGEAALERHGREPERRPDRYLVLKDRTDIGLKLRGGAEDQFDVKVLHRRERGWELWEKITFFRWDDLEAARFAALLQREVRVEQSGAKVTPAAGVTAALRTSAIESSELTLQKRRLQTRAAELAPKLPGAELEAATLVELAEIQVPGMGSPALSVCFETMAPARNGAVPMPGNGGVCCGYPEFLVRCTETAR